MENRNIDYTYMTNLWGNINYKQINNFDEWYMGDFGSAYYYQDWDKILRYFAGAGFKDVYNRQRQDITKEDILAILENAY